MNRHLVIAAPPAEEELLLRTTPEERRAAASFAPRRRAEYLGWRALVRLEAGDVRIVYDAAGAPRIADDGAPCIGVSHGAGRVAVAFSDRPCAVDVESLLRPFDRLVSRYLTVEERRLGGADAHFPAAAWCAKETLYKLAGRRELDLLRDLRLTAAGEGWIEGRICGGAPLRLDVRMLDGDAVVVWRL